VENTPMTSVDERRTARLLLTRVKESDLADLVRFNSDERVMATLGGVRPSVEDNAQRLRLHLSHWERHGFGWWVARDLATGAFAGRGGLRRGFWDSDREEVELGYGFMAEFWGRGLATELAEESVRVAFEVLGLPELVCFTLPTNLGSRRVMEKVGFAFERDGVWATLPHVFYRQTAEQWRRRKASDLGVPPPPAPG
jgi:ribosomal-protein-alanine N-acetyltransferase